MLRVAAQGLAAADPLSSNVRRHTPDSRRMLETPKILAWYLEELAALSVGQRRLLECFRIDPYVLDVVDTPNEPVVAVAHYERWVIYWSDFEEGWEIGEPDGNGRIATRGSNQFSLSHLVEHLPAAD